MGTRRDGERTGRKKGMGYVGLSLEGGEGGGKWGGGEFCREEQGG